MSIMTCATAATIPVLGTGNCPRCHGDFESCQCTGVAQTSTTTSLRAGWYEEQEERDNELGPMPDETEFHQLVQHLVDQGDDRAQKTGRHARRTLAEMAPEYVRQPVLVLHRPVMANDACPLCHRWNCDPSNCPPRVAPAPTLAAGARTAVPA
ncbi:hypothetical protein [Streptomyces sp. NPDC002403]